MSIVKNSRQAPTIWYGKHMAPGVAEYRDIGKDPFRILLNENVIRDMDSTFAGKPVYVRHVDEVNLDNIQNEADGYVIESFYNQADAAHWVKFIVVSDQGAQAVRNGWRLSNAYIPKSYGPGGVSKGVEYQKEVMAAEYEHLALVPDPRYEDSIVLTPAQFKEYNRNHVEELKKVANAAKSSTGFNKMLGFFRKSKVENVENIGEILVKLPKTGKELSIEQMVNALDIAKVSPDAGKKLNDQDVQESQPSSGSLGAPHNDEKSGAKVKEHSEHKDGGENKEEQEKQGRAEEEKGSAPQMANMDHHVMVGNESRPLKEVMEEHSKMRDCMNNLSMHHAKLMKNMEAQDGGEKDAKSAQDADLTKKNADLDPGEKQGVAEEKQEDLTKRNSKENFEAIKNAPQVALETKSRVSVLEAAERGKARYGSN